MNLNTKISKAFLKRKIVTAVFIAASVAAFATLGEGGEGGKKGKKLAKITQSTDWSAKSFSLKSKYAYKGNNILNTHPQSNYILLNTEVTYQKGNAIYTVPLKKKLLLDKIKFNPAQK